MATRLVSSALVASLVCGMVPSFVAASGAGATEEQDLDAWLSAEGLNEYGDKPDTMYMGGTPLFDERTGEFTQRLDHVRAKFPHRPWVTKAPGKDEEHDEEWCEGEGFEEDEDESTNSGGRKKGKGKSCKTQTKPDNNKGSRGGRGGKFPGSALQGNAGPERSEQSKFPAHWGNPPHMQTRDLRLLPGGYGKGSSTLAGWIQRNLDKDASG